MLSAESIIKCMVGGAILHVQYIDGEAAYWLTESNGLTQVVMPAAEAKASHGIAPGHAMRAGAAR